MYHKLMENSNLQNIDVGTVSNLVTCRLFIRSLQYLQDNKINTRACWVYQQSLTLMLNSSSNRQISENMRVHEYQRDHRVLIPEVATYL
jgi:hypothetical protein